MTAPAANESAAQRAMRVAQEESDRAMEAARDSIRQAVEVLREARETLQPGRCAPGDARRPAP
jgi:hypothetical protein